MTQHEFIVELESVRQAKVRAVAYFVFAFGVKFFSCLSISLLTSGCDSGGKVLSPDEQVYEFAINEIVQDAAKEIYIFNNYNYGIISTESTESLMGIYSQLETFPSLLLSELLENSKVPGTIRWRPIMVNATFIDAELEQPLPNSYHYITRVALDHTSMEAVVLFGYACPALCGAHETIFTRSQMGNQERCTVMDFISTAHKNDHSVGFIGRVNNALVSKFLYV
jgi:hypothetical protein